MSRKSTNIQTSLGRFINFSKMVQLSAEIWTDSHLGFWHNSDFGVSLYAFFKLNTIFIGWVTCPRAVNLVFQFSKIWSIPSNVTSHTLPGRTNPMIQGNHFYTYKFCIWKPTQFRLSQAHVQKEKNVTASVLKFGLVCTWDNPKMKVPFVWNLAKVDN